jgi:hypothetical protein
MDPKELPTCKWCGTKLVDREHFKNRKAYDYFRRYRKCMKCQDYDQEGRGRRAKPRGKTQR